MAARDKTIIACAATGSVRTASMSPHLPVTREEIVEASVDAAEAGAVIIHLHARDAETGKPDQTPEAFGRFLPQTRQRTNALLNLTTGPPPGVHVEERVKPAALFKPEVASLKMVSMNFGLYPMLDKFKSFKHGRERAALEGSRDLVFRNTFKDIEYVLTTSSKTGTRFEFERYDTARL